MNKVSVLETTVVKRQVEKKSAVPTEKYMFIALGKTYPKRPNTLFNQSEHGCRRMVSNKASQD